MSKNRLSIRRNRSGVITVDFGGSEPEIHIRAKTGRENFEAVRAVILAKGLVFTKKVEKMARKASWS